MYVYYIVLCSSILFYLYCILLIILYYIILDYILPYHTILCYMILYHAHAHQYNYIFIVYNLYIYSHLVSALPALAIESSPALSCLDQYSLVV